MPQMDSFMRWIYLFDDSESLTREYYISEIMLSYLFSSGISKITAKEAVEYLEEEDNFGALFTVEEVEEALNSKVGLYFDVSNDCYCISSEGEKEYAKRPKNNLLRFHINRYVDGIGKQAGDYEALKNCLLEFIYDQFCTNVSAITRLLTGQQIEISRIGNYDPEEVEFVNGFLNWDDVEKNKYIATLLSKAYDFCVIASDCAEDKCIEFEKCHFYLDTNIVFRLAGLNSETRRELTSRFINKSLELNCHVYYSQFTKDELYNAIDRQVDYIEDICKDFSLIEPNEMEQFMPVYMSVDIYTLFYIWTNKGVKQKDYKAFKGYLYEKCESVLQYFNEDSSTPSFFVDPQGYAVEAFRDSLAKAERDKPRDAVKTDINNVLMVNQARSRNKDFIYSLITADHGLIRWTSEAFGGQSLAELPSVWLSIMLRFGGRTSNHDYKAFCQFIKIPVSGKTDSLPDKLDLLACVQLATNDADIKNKLLRELRINSNRYKSIKKPDKKVIIAGSTIIDSMYTEIVSKVTHEAEHSADKKYTALLDELRQEMEKRTATSISELNEKFVKLTEKNTVQKQNEKLQTIESIAIAKAGRQLIKYWIFTILIFIIVVFAFLRGWGYIKPLISNSETSTYINYFALFAPLIAYFIDVIFYKTLFQDLNKDKIICKNIYSLGKISKFEYADLNAFCKSAGYKS